MRVTGATSNLKTPPSLSTIAYGKLRSIQSVDIVTSVRVRRCCWPWRYDRLPIDVVSAPGGERLLVWLAVAEVLVELDDWRNVGGLCRLRSATQPANFIPINHYYIYFDNIMKLTLSLDITLPLKFCMFTSFQTRESDWVTHAALQKLRYLSIWLHGKGYSRSERVNTPRYR